MRKIITLMYFRLGTDIIGLPVYFAQYAFITEESRSEFGMNKPKVKSAKLFSCLILHNER
jgi:hypothetical protein